MANTFFAKHKSRFQLKGTHHIMIGLQYTRQDALNNGGNIEPRKTFIDKGASANIISGRIAYEQTAWKAGLNYPHHLSRTFSDAARMGQRTIVYIHAS